MYLPTGVLCQALCTPSHAVLTRGCRVIPKLGGLEQWQTRMSSPRFCGSAGSLLKVQEGVLGAGEPLPRQQGTRAVLWCVHDRALETHRTKAAWTPGEAAATPPLEGRGGQELWGRDLKLPRPQVTAGAHVQAEETVQ